MSKKLEKPIGEQQVKTSKTQPLNIHDCEFGINTTVKFEDNYFTHVLQALSLATQENARAIREIASIFTGKQIEVVGINVVREK